MTLRRCCYSRRCCWPRRAGQELLQPVGRLRDRDQHGRLEQLRQHGGARHVSYTCIAPTESYDGTTINSSNTTQTASAAQHLHGRGQQRLLYASSATTQPSCSTEASPSDAEPGFLLGRGKQNIRYTSNTKSIKGSKMIHTAATETPAVPHGAQRLLTSQLAYSKTKTYTWKNLAEKCEGLAGRCVITNAVWEEHLECCTSRTGLASDWDTTFETYQRRPSRPRRSAAPPSRASSSAAWRCSCASSTSAPRCANGRGRRRSCASRRPRTTRGDMDAAHDGGQAACGVAAPHRTRQLDVSLHEGDQIYRKKEDELLFEGDMY
ncbi:uncharacterized protein KRP23_3015 [Phytophthora ramorum]|uniref:uncharacterized protein n=1 Tax=Phytophthora ramorum TaxID=164328 RepID=UPI00309DE2BE|nr:hypothetical protein KRP23_3015 [Phytophthora ramorum]